MDDSRLTLALCQHLSALPGWEWSPDGDGYSNPNVGIFHGAIPDAPHRAVGVRVYGLAGDNARGVRGRRVQLRYRGIPDVVGDVDRLADLGQLLLTSLSRSAGISGIFRESFASLGTDSNRREERTDNFVITLDNPEAS